jgi:hypothetical protein
VGKDRAQGHDRPIFSGRCPQSGQTEGGRRRHAEISQRSRSQKLGSSLPRQPNCSKPRWSSAVVHDVRLLVASSFIGVVWFGCFFGISSRRSSQQLQSSISAAPSLPATPAESFFACAGATSKSAASAVAATTLMASNIGTPQTPPDGNQRKPRLALVSERIMIDGRELPTPPMYRLTESQLVCRWGSVSP